MFTGFQSRSQLNTYYEGKHYFTLETFGDPQLRDNLSIKTKREPSHYQHMHYLLELTQYVFPEVTNNNNVY